MNTERDIYDWMIQEDINSPEDSLLGKLKKHFKDNPTQNFKNFIDALTSGCVDIKLKDLRGVEDYIRQMLIEHNVEEKYFDVFKSHEPVGSKYMDGTYYWARKDQIWEPVKAWVEEEDEGVFLRFFRAGSEVPVEENFFDEIQEAKGPQ